MGVMPRQRPPHLQYETTRHKRKVWYFRRGDGPRIRIRGEYGTPEFQSAYEAARDGQPAPQSKAKTQSGSLRWLYERYRETTRWTDLAASSRYGREKIFEHVMATAGDQSYRSIFRKHIVEGRDRRRNTPAQARKFLDAMRGLFAWAFEAGHITDDPTIGVKNPKQKKSEGFKPWNMDDVARYEARWPGGTRQRVWMHVLLYVGARRGDAVALGKQHARDGILTFVTEKGREKKRIEVARPIEPELAATIARGPCGDLAFICGERGTPLTKESFGNDFKESCVAAGIMTKTAHGLRKLSAEIWAERGATPHQLMSMFGWLSLQMAEHYTKGAQRRRMAIAAAKLIGTEGGHPIPAPEDKVRETR